MANDLETFIIERDYLTSLWYELSTITYNLTYIKTACNATKITKKERKCREARRDAIIKRRLALKTEIKDIDDALPDYTTTFTPHMIDKSGKAQPFKAYQSITAAIIKRNKTKRVLKGTGELSELEAKSERVCPRTMAYTTKHKIRVPK